MFQHLASSFCSAAKLPRRNIVGAPARWTGPADRFPASFQHRKTGFNPIGRWERRKCISRIDLRRRAGIQQQQGRRTGKQMRS